MTPIDTGGTGRQFPRASERLKGKVRTLMLGSDPTKACTGGSCRQGRARCETPEACHLPETPRISLGTALALVAVVILVALGAVHFVAGYVAALIH